MYVSIGLDSGQVKPSQHPTQLLLKNEFKRESHIKLEVSLRASRDGMKEELLFRVRKEKERE